MLHFAITRQINALPYSPWANGGAAPCFAVSLRCQLALVALRADLNQPDMQDGLCG